MRIELVGQFDRKTGLTVASKEPKGSSIYKSIEPHASVHGGERSLASPLTRTRGPIPSPVQQQGDGCFFSFRSHRIDKASTRTAALKG